MNDVIRNDKSLTPEQEAARRSWQWRAIVATRGNQTRLGALVLAVVGKMTDNPPRITGHATITKDGWVVCPFHKRDGTQGPMIVGDVEYLTRSFSELGDHLKLNDADRIAMFKAVKEWIYKDERDGKPPLEFRKGI